jgi:hypothetical protein
LPANIGIDQTFCRDPSRCAKGFRCIIRGTGAQADTAILKSPNGGNGVDCNRNGLRLSGIAKGCLDSGASQVAWSGPFASDGLPTGFTYTNDYWRARIKIGHFGLPIIS